MQSATSGNTVETELIDLPRVLEPSSEIGQHVAFAFYLVRIDVQQVVYRNADAQYGVDLIVQI